MKDKITEHFYWNEANCKDGTIVPVDLQDNVIEQARNLEILREILGGVPIHINSWYRTEAYNKSEGGSPRSQHLRGKATDIWISGMLSITLYTVIECLLRMHALPEGGLGLYDTFVHYDSRGSLSRWNLSTKY